MRRGVYGRALRGKRAGRNLVIKIQSHGGGGGENTVPGSGELVGLFSSRIPSYLEFYFDKINSPTWYKI